MTNKELFNRLNKEQQMQIVKTLVSFKKCHVEFYCGEYHITTSYCLMSRYPSDFKMLNEFYQNEFYPNGTNYHNDWYKFWNEKEAKGEKNECYKVNGEIHGKWQDEFEKSYEPIYQKALNNFLNR